MVLVAVGPVAGNTPSVRFQISRAPMNSILATNSCLSLPPALLAGHFQVYGVDLGGQGARARELVEGAGQSF